MLARVIKSTSTYTTTKLKLKLSLRINQRFFNAEPFRHQNRLSRGGLPPGQAVTRVRVRALKVGVRIRARMRVMIRIRRNKAMGRVSAQENRLG